MPPVRSRDVCATSELRVCYGSDATNRLHLTNPDRRTPCPWSRWSSSRPPAASARSTSTPACSTTASCSSAAQVDEETANLIVAQLVHLESDDPDKDIHLYINSPGGSIYAGLAIYDTMQFIRPDVQTICYGIAMSMGSLLLAGGAPGKRMALPNSRILIHQPSGGFEGQSSDIEIHAREVLALRARVDEIYAQHTGQSVERVHADMERDRYFTGEEASPTGSSTG